MTSTADPVSPRRRPRDRKQQILLAARDLIVANGYPGVSMAAIAEQVGITAGALYRHFANKAVLLERVFEDSFSWLDVPVTQVDYDKAVDEIITLVVDRPYLSDLWTHELKHLPQEKRRDLRRRMRAWNDSLKPALRSRRPDLDDGQAELLLWSVQSMIASVGRGTFRAPRVERVPAVRAGLQALTSAELVPTGPPAAPQRRRKLPNSMRERLLLAAIQQFGERGFQETSMASLGAAVDVTGPNLYSYFESKGDLIRAVFERNSHALWIDLDQALANSADAAGALLKLTRSYIARAHSWASTAEDPRGEHEQAESVLAFRREYIAEWVALLVEAEPALSPRAARLRVRLALFLVADLYSNARIVAIETFEENLARLVLAVLFHSAADAP